MGATRPGWRWLGFFFLAWVTLPMIFRGVIIGRWQGEALIGVGLVKMGAGLALGGVQDAFIATQALVCMLALRRFIGGERRAWRWLGAGLLTLASVYYLFDVLLFWVGDLRMTASFLQFIRDAESFMDSAEDVGVLRLGLCIGAVIAAAIWASRKLRRPLEQARLSVASAGVLGVIAAVAITSALAAPGELMYRANNVILDDQIEAARALLGIEDPLIELARGHDEALWIPQHATERARWLDADRHPLLRETLGFQGPRRFELRVDADERPHVIVLVMESFRALDIGAYGSPLGASPRFDALAAQGILFSDFYATGVQTTRSVISILHGIMPRFSGFSVQAHEPDMPLIGLAEIFKNRGYDTAYIFNGELDFENMEQFFANRAYDEVFGEHDMEAAFPGAERFSWGVHDEYLMDFAVDWLEEKDSAGEAAFATMFTISNHHPWTPPERHQIPDFPSIEDETYGRFIRAFYYSDLTLGRFVDALRERGLAEKTILIITADTSQAMGEHNNWSVSRNLHEENARIPLLILADGRLTPQKINAVGSQIDILPTLLDIMGWEGETNHAAGASLMREDDDHKAFFESPYALQYWGLRHQSWKYFYLMRSDEHRLFDLSTDPGELRDVSRQHPERVQRYMLDVARMHRLFDHLHETRGFTPQR